jgi:hypothetical protein
MTTTLSVIWRRDARGIVQSFEIHRGGELLLDTAACSDPDAALEDILWNARAYYKCDPMDDKLPPDHAIITMYEEHIA